MLTHTPSVIHENAAVSITLSLIQAHMNQRPCEIFYNDSNNKSNRKMACITVSIRIDVFVYVHMPITWQVCVCMYSSRIVGILAYNSLKLERIMQARHRHLISQVKISARVERERGDINRAVLHSSVPCLPLCWALSWYDSKLIHV